MKTKITIILFCIGSFSMFSQNFEVFETIGEFQNAVNNNCSSTDLTNENFDGIIQTLCGVPILPDPDQECFDQGELESGFTLEGSSGDDMAVTEQGGLGGSPVNLAYSNNTTDAAIINFDPPVNAVAFTLWEIVNGSGTTVIDVFGDNNELLGSITKNTPNQQAHFFSVITDQPIFRIETEGPNNGGNLIGALFFGASNCTTRITILDTNFEQLLINLGLDDVIDGSVDPNNINNVTTLDVSSSNISNLKGLEAFTALESFTCTDNPLTEIDLTDNINLNTVIVNNNSELIALLLEPGTSAPINPGNSNLNQDRIVITSLDATNNPNLQCVQVNNVTDAQNNPNWFIDATAEYNTDCSPVLDVTSFIDISALISLYPNPVINSLRIENSTNFEITGAVIYDNLGRRVNTNLVNNTIDVSALKTGLYFINILTQNGNVTKKFIKK